MQNGDIIVIESVRELLDDKEQVVGRVITDKAGNETKIKKGQGGKLQERWEWLDENTGKAIKLTVRDFKPPNSDRAYPFVADFTVVKDEFVAQAAEKVQTQAKTDRNDSIERQVAIKEVGLDWREGKRKDNDILVVTREAWLIDAMNYKEAKGEATKTDNKTTDQQQGEERTIGQNSGEALEVQPKTVGEFLTYLAQHGIKSPRVFLDAEYKVSDKEVLTLKKCQELYKEIKKDKGW